MAQQFPECPYCGDLFRPWMPEIQKDRAVLVRRCPACGYIEVDRFLDLE